MTATRTSPRITLALMVWLVSQAASAAAQDTLVHAKELYVSAAYDEALAVLDRLQYEATGSGATEVAQYRAFCLLALDRSGEAQKVIEEIVNADPFYQPSEADTSPRLRTAFEKIRRPLLPVVVQRLYADARAAFERKDPQAAAQFDRIIALLDDPDLKGGASSDLKVVASGFRDLSKATSAAAAAAPPVAPVPSVSPTTPAPAPEPVLISSPAVAREPGVTPAVAISQPLPSWAPSKTADRQQGFRGTLEVTIDEHGDVQVATMRESVHPLYDPELLKIARTWKFKPATKDGVPIVYSKMIEIQLLPRK